MKSLPILSSIFADRKLVLSRSFYFAILLFVSLGTFAQPGTMFINQDVSGSYSNYTCATVGSTFQYRIQENGSGTSAGTRNWQFNADSYYNTWGVMSTNGASSVNISAYNVTIPANTATASANWQGGPGYNSKGRLLATQANYYYTYNIERGSSYASQVMSVLETSYNPVTISSVTAAAGTYGSRLVTITTSGTPNAGENIFVRYSTNGYTSSTLVQATGSGTTWTANIPWQSSAVSYYVYTSNKSLATINSEVTSYGQVVHDVSMLNLNNNSGSNYSWTPATGSIIVTSTGGTLANTPTAYSTFTLASALFADLNAGVKFTGSVTALITADVTTETGATTLNASAAWTSLGIQPNGARTVSGAAATGVALMGLAGAKNVTIDGLNTGGNSLTISNTAIGTTAGSSTIAFTADASNNNVQNCTILGSAANTSALAMGTIYFGTGASTGNNSNTINANTISAAGANLPTNAIYSAGTSTAIANSSNSITNNNIADYYNAAGPSIGLYLASNSSAWTITGNKFYQTATRTSTASGNTYEAIKIVTASGLNYNVSNNTIGYSASGGTGTMTYAGAFSNRFIGIDMTVGTATASSVQGNTIAAISLSTTSGAASTYGIFTGIYVLAGNVNIGTTTGNTIGSASTTSSISITSTTSLGLITGINCTSTGTVNIQNNTIAGISTGGLAAIGYTFDGIVTSGAAGVFTISSNTIGSSSTANSIAIGTSGTTTTGVCTFLGILNSATGNTSITSNNILNCSIYGTTAADVFNGISNTAACATLNMNSNVIYGIAISCTGGGTFIGITNSGAVATTINMNSNNLGNSTAGFITFSAASSGTLYGIYNSGGASTAALSISTNNFQGITHSVAASTVHNYIVNNAATLSQTISNNTFTNLSVATTGSVSFITNDVALSSTGTCTVNSNSIVTAFAKTGAGGTVSVYLTSTSPSSAVGATKSEQSNNFSNVTLTGATAVNIWSDLEGVSGGGATKTISGNTFSNWTCGSSAVVGILTNFSGNNTAVSGNTLSSITGTGAVTGISIGSSNGGATETVSGNTISSLSGTTVIGITGGSTGITTTNLNGNTINTLTASTTNNATGIAMTTGTTVNINGNTIYAVSTATGTAYGISITTGTMVNVFKNNIYGMTATGAITTALSVDGIYVFTTNPSSLNIYNNTIGLLTAPAGNGDNLIAGIDLVPATNGTASNVYFNTIYLSASTSGANLGSSCIYQTANASSGRSDLTLKNNILINATTQKGTGFVAALRRTSTGLANYTTTSNNNIFYAGTPGANNMLYYESGGLSAQTIAAYQALTGMSPRESCSQTENTGFQSVVGSNANFLRIAAGTTSYAESGGKAISSPAITDDYWAVTRNTVTPDIGASEFSGTSSGTAATVTALSNATFCPTGNGTVTITGTGFSCVAGITFGGVAATTYTVSSTTSITAVTVPAGISSGNVVVYTSGGGSATGSGNAYTVNASPTITTQPSATSVNAFNAATATFTVATSASSPTYQWQYATAATGPWSNVADGTPAGITYSGTGTSATLSVVSATTAVAGSAYYYQCIVTAGGCSTTSGNAQLTINNYCASTGTTSASSAYITNITAAGLTTLNNTTGYTTNGYTYYSAASPAVSQISGGTVTYSATISGVSGGVDFGIWVDWNNNGVFTDAGEHVVTAGTSTQITTNPSGSFTVPVGQAAGSYRMRTVVNYATGTAVSCNSAITGETEDYIFTVILPATPTITSFTPTTLCSGGGQTVTITGTNFTGTTAVTFNGTAAASFTVVSGTSITATTPSGLTAGTITVTNSAGSVTSGSSYTVNPSPVITGNPSATSVNAFASSTATFTASTSTGAPTYQWQYATSGSGPWTNVADGTPTGITYSGTGTSASLSAVSTTSAVAGSAYYYNCVITAGGCNSTTTAAQLTINNYCYPTTSSASTYINSFSTTSGLTNITNNTTGYTTGGYANYTAQSVSQYPNTAINWSVTMAGGTAGIAIWIDWNNNGVFTDAGENVYNSNAYQPTGITTGSFTVPSGQAAGNYRMRVLTDYSATIPVSCSYSGTRGEAEDYTFTVTPLVVPTITSLGSSIGCIGSSLTINGTGLAGATAANVKIGGTAVSSITSNTGTVMVVVVGSGTTGTVAVTTVGGTATSSGTYTFATAPTAGITGTSPGCSSITLTASPSSGVTYAWSSGGSTASTASFSTSGTYLVTVTDANACTASATQTIVVNTPPSVTTQPSTSNVTYCSGYTVTALTVVASGTSPTYQWYSNTTSSNSGGTLIAGATSASYTPSNAYTTGAATYYYCVVSGASPCTPATSNVSGGITISAGPTAGLTGTTPGCSSITLTATPSTGVTYAWSSGGSTISTSSFATSGTYRVTVTDVNTCSASASLTIVVNTPPSVTTQPSNSNVTYCSGSTVTALTVVATGTSPTYQWYSNATSSNSGGTLIAGATSASYTPSNAYTTGAATYYYCVVSGASPCTPATSSVSGGITINPSPIITGNPSATSVNAFAGASTSFTAATSTGSPTYQWQFATSTGGTWNSVVDNTPTGITYSGSGTSATLSVVSATTAVVGSAYYYRCVITAAGCSSTTGNAQLTINNYCASTGTGSAVYITNVSTTGGVTNLNNTSVFTAGGYNYYSSLSPTVSQVAGGAVNFNSTVSGISGGVCYGIFVDWNNNGVFTDAGENVWVSGSSQISTNPSGSFTVPGGQASGNYRMRVVVNYSGTTASSCNSSINGETEDYIFTVVTPCITFSPSAPTICAGTNTTITASGGTGYTWSTGATIAAITVAPTTTTTYSVTPTGSCTVPAFMTITVNPAPAAVTVTPATVSICQGAIQTLTASGGTGATATVLSQNFDAAGSSGLPTGWARSSTYSTTYSDWPNTSQNVSSGNTWSAPHSGANCMYFYSYIIGTGSQGTIETPAMDLSSYTAASLSFWVYNSGGTDVLKVYAKQGAGTYAQVGSTSYGVYGSWTQITISLNSYSGTGFNAVKVEFQGTSDFGNSNIGLDDVTVTATSPAPFTWNTNITSLYTDAGATTPYTSGALASVVYAKPSATQTYTATTSLGSCPATNTSVVTVNANSWTGVTSTDWNVGSNWCSGTVPVSTTDVIIPSGTPHQPTIGPSTAFAAVCNNITINSGATLTMSNTSSLTVSALATFQNNGTFSPASGTTVSFAGAGTVSGANATTFSNLTINTGTVTIPTTSGLIPTVSGTLLINGGNVSAAVIYGSSSTLEYNVSYGRYVEWNAAGVGTIGTTPGYPNNVLISTGTYDVYNSATGVARALAGTLTVASGATMNFNGMNAAFTIGGNVVVGGTMNMNTMSNTLTSAGYLQINSGGALNMNTMSSSLNFASYVLNNGTLALSTAGGGDIYVGGSWTRGSTGTFTPNTRAVFFTGSGTEVVTVTGGGTETFNYLVVGGSGTMQIASGTTVWVNYSGGLTLSTTNSTSSIDLNGQTMILFGGGNLNLSSGSRYITSSTGTGTFQIQSNLTTVSGLGTLTFVSGTVLDLKNGFDGGASGAVHMDSKLQIDAGGYWTNNGHAPTYGSGSILNYNTGSSFTAAPSAEWYENTVAQPGVPYNVVISTSGSELDFNSSGYKHEMWGDLTINTGTTLALHGGSGNAGADFYIKGNWYNSGTFTGNGRMAAFNGTTAQTLTGATTFDYFQIINSAGLTINNDITINNVGYMTTGIITTGSNKVITTSTAGGALSGQSASSYIKGNVQRAVAASTGYDFPVGDGTHYQLATIYLNSTSGMSNIVGKFTTGAPATGPSPSTCLINNTPITSMLDGGYWTLTPDAGTANYDLTLHEAGYSTTPSVYHLGLIKRHDASSPWLGTDLAGTNGYHSNANSSVISGVASVKRTGITSFSDYGIGSSTTYALPVRLLYFTAVNKEDNGQLAWATATEVNNDHFEIERSLDGTTFETVGEVVGHGNSTVTIDYGFTDPNLSSHGVSVIYYRLKQVDVDGHYEYSNIASVEVKSAQQIFHIISTYPNPFADHFSVSFFAPAAESVRVSVYDVRGALVSEEMVNAETGMNVYSIPNASKLASGFYTMNISAGGKNYSVKMLKGEK